MKRRSNDELAQLVWSQINRATDYANTSLQENRKKAWDYYLCRPRGDEVEGRSQLIDTTVRDHHHALMSTIMPSYATDHLVQFEPDGQGDEDAAEAESNAVNNIFTENNSGYQELTNAISDALLFRNGVIKVWVEETVEQGIVRYSPDEATPAQITVALEQQGVEVSDIEEADNELRVTYQRKVEQLKVRCIEPSYFGCDPNQQDNNLQEAFAITERSIYNRGELLDMGVSRTKIDRIPELADEGVTSSTTMQDVTAKFIDGQPTYQAKDGAWHEQRCDCYWVHMHVDGEKWRFLCANQMILLKDPVAYFPYASGAAWPVPHRWSGLSLYDLLKQTQDSKTSITRQYHDNLNNANNFGFVYDPNVTESDDIADRFPGASVRSDAPERVVPLAIPDITTQALAGLAHWDDVAGRQAGAALDMATAEAQGIKDVSGLSVEMQLGPKEQMASQISRNIAEGLVRQTFELIHRALREDYSGVIQYRKTDQWITVRPSEWRPRNRINVVVGLSPGDRRRHRAALSEVLQLQQGLIAGGAANIAVNYKNHHNAITDWLKASGLDGHENYFLDPDGQQSQQAQQAASMEQQQNGAIMQKLQEITIQLEQQKLREDARQHDDEMRFKYTELQTETETELQIAEGEQTNDRLQTLISADSEMARASETGSGNGAD